MGCKSPKTGVIKSCNELSLETPLDAPKAERALAMVAQAGLLAFLQAWKGSEALIFLSSVGKKTNPTLQGKLGEQVASTPRPFQNSQHSIAPILCYIAHDPLCRPMTQACPILCSIAHGLLRRPV